MNEFWDKKGIKLFCAYINPIIIGVDIPLIFDFWNKNWTGFYIAVFVGIILLFLFAYTSYRTIRRENEKGQNEAILRTKIDSLEEKNKNLIKKEQSFDRGMRELATLFYDSSTSLNKISNHILHGDTTLDLWNFKKVSTGICNSIYNLLCEICNPCNDFTVNIMLADATATGNKRNITMIAHKGKYEKYPSKFEEKLYFNKYSSFYAVKVCKSNNTDIRILTTKAEVNEKFVYVDEDHPEYSQYVGIPIVCSGNKIICLLQICAFGNDKIGETKADILQIITKYIFPFTHYALLTYKVEKSLVSSFFMIDKNGKGGISDES